MTRSEYRSRLEASLQTMEARISDLESKIVNSQGQGKTKFQSLLDEVRSKRDAVRVKLRQAGTATDSAWSELKHGLDRAWDELQSSYDRARSRFADAAS